MTPNDASVARVLMLKKAEGYTIKPFISEGKKKYYISQCNGSAFEMSFEKTLDEDWIKGFTPKDLGGLASEESCGGYDGCKCGTRQPWEQDENWWKK